MVRLSVDSVTGFSIAPLRFATWLGVLGGVAALTVLVYALLALVLGTTVPGWTSTVVIVSAVGGAQLLALGILGEYVGRTYAALQGRPAWFVAHDSLAAGALARPVTSTDARELDDLVGPAGRVQRPQTRT
jgi:dolichol-phosphate mannosyltransferase